ncbi:glycosyltransferase [Stenotrophomonas sp. Iso1]|uniref:glycosyltransferase n=1 Tax=Stenotrophomonas sp. Iso1 TaxID=2977283 RepID=UPI0022B7BC42|nr:glycosyltransferase [Stenotrophomonas sp. Iso1]
MKAVDGANFSLLFCAYNEAASMPTKLGNLRALKSRYPALEILAFDDGSVDGTAALIAQDATLVTLVKGDGRNGKAHGMKLLAKRARGRFLIFTDANVLLDTDALTSLDACYADPSVGGVCGSLHYLAAEGTVTAKIGGLYWRLEERIKDLESVSGSVMGADGSIFSIRAELYPDFPDTVLDDFTTSMEVVFRDKRLIKSNNVRAFEQLVSSRSDEYARKIRIAARAFHTHMTCSHKRKNLTLANKFRYFSHKTLRWFGGGFLVIGAVTGIGAITLLNPALGIGTLTVLAAAFYIGLRFQAGTLSSIVEIVIAMIATLTGVFRAIRGQTFATWNPAKSRI